MEGNSARSIQFVGTRRDFRGLIRFWIEEPRAWARSGDNWRRVHRGRYRSCSVKVFHEHEIRFVEILLHVYKRMAVGGESHSPPCRFF